MMIGSVLTGNANDTFIKKGQTVMEDIEKVMGWLEGLTFDDWRDYHSDSEVSNMAKATLELLKEQQEKIRQLESMNVSASDNGTAIGILHGGMTIKKEYHQQAKEVYNIGHVDRLDL